MDGSWTQASAAGNRPRLSPRPSNKRPSAPTQTHAHLQGRVGGVHAWARSHLLTTLPVPVALQEKVCVVVCVLQQSAHVLWLHGFTVFEVVTLIALHGWCASRLALCEVFAPGRMTSEQHGQTTNGNPGPLIRRCRQSTESQRCATDELPRMQTQDHGPANAALPTQQALQLQNALQPAPTHLPRVAALPYS